MAGVIGIYLFVAALIAITINNLWVFAGALILLVLVGLYTGMVSPIIEDRQRKRRIAEMQRLDRESIDLHSGWVKKPWQHEVGECTRQRKILDERIESFALKSATAESSCNHLLAPRSSGIDGSE
ncbi:hypothetical protein [Pseudomonas sp. NPDC096950]|uniref:hypothetical protein n=1 Tax=Pseudomonas sp. NPDC096950 TaxID=3364485 RepID=UPI003839FC8C